MSINQYVLRPTAPYLDPYPTEKKIRDLGEAYIGKGSPWKDFTSATEGQVCYCPAHRGFYRRGADRWHLEDEDRFYLTIDETSERRYFGRLSMAQNDILSILLDKDIVFLNTPWAEEELPVEVRKNYIAAYVNTNDLFGPAADGELVTFHELPELFVYCLQYGWSIGSVYWAIRKTRHKPWSKGMRGLDPKIVDRCVAGESVID